VRLVVLLQARSGVAVDLCRGSGDGSVHQAAVLLSSLAEKTRGADGISANKCVPLFERP